MRGGEVSAKAREGPLTTKAVTRLNEIFFASGQTRAEASDTVPMVYALSRAAEHFFVYPAAPWAV
jgi:hypothetical protein